MVAVVTAVLLFLLPFQLVESIASLTDRSLRETVDRQLAADASVVGRHYSMMKSCDELSPVSPFLDADKPPPAQDFVLAVALASSLDSPVLSCTLSRRAVHGEFVEFVLWPPESAAASETTE